MIEVEISRRSGPCVDLSAFDFFHPEELAIVARVIEMVNAASNNKEGWNYKIKETEVEGDRQRGRWIAEVQLGHRWLSLGIFNSEVEAQERVKSSKSAQKHRIRTITES